MTLNIPTSSEPIASNFPMGQRWYRLFVDWLRLFNALGLTTTSTQADQETGTSSTTAVTPSVQQFHPSACKQWVKFNTAGTIAASYNTASVTDVGVGNWAVIIGTDMSSVDYAIAAGGSYISTGNFPIVYSIGTNQVADGYQILAWRSDVATTLADPTAADTIFGIAFGDQ